MANVDVVKGYLGPAICSDSSALISSHRLQVPATDEDGEYSPVISPRSKKRQKKEEEAEEEQARKEKVDDFFGLGLANMKKAGGPPARKKKRLAI